MKNFYIKTAITNLKKNARLYIPQIISGAVMFSIFYIMLALTTEDTLLRARGARYIPTFMSIGCIIIVLLSIVMAFYSNGFLMKQRRREYGLYNVLGLEKKHVILIMFIENMFSFLGQLLIGSVIGICFYRLSTLVISKIIKINALADSEFFSPIELLVSIIVFGFIFVLTLIYNVVSVLRLNPVDLLKSSSTGEKEPKVKWLLFVLGILCLSVGYVMALIIESPVTATLAFFAAVILVIFGTYFLFTAGSIFVLKVLKKNKKYYYRPDHMISVSGMLYRMKQNAAGLASIALLATGVLIMISTTVAMYGGVEKSIEQQYPQDVYFKVNIFQRKPEGEHKKISYDEAESFFRKSADEAGLNVTMFTEEKFFETGYILDGNELKCEMSNPDTSTFYESGLSDPRVKCITFLDTECYNNLTGNKLELSNDEMALGSLGSGSWNPESIKIADMELKSKETIENPPISSEVASVVECYLMVVNEENFEKIFKDQEEKYGKGIGDEDYNGTRKAVDQVTDKLEGSRNYASQMTIRFAANVEGPEENISELYRIFVDKVSAITDDDYYTNVNWSSAVGMRGDLYDMNGSLMFLGMLLSLVCLISTAIIIYYKQISEGYEDRNNFQIMQKVGLTKEEIKKTIGNQILTVFFLPLIIAGIHTIVAYPMVKNIMKLFAMASEQMLLSCIGIVFAIFALVYVVIYRITAKTYYKIVK